MSTTSSVSLRRRLRLVAAAGILPMAIAAGLGLSVLMRDQWRAADAKTREVTRLAAAAIDVELERNIAALRTLALSPLLERGDLAAYNTLLRRFLEVMPAWHSISLATPERRFLLNTAVPRGAPMPALAEPASFAEVLRSRDAAVGRLVRRADGEWGVAVRVPVLRDGRLVYVLTAVVKPDAFVRVVQSQRLPDTWTLSVFDATGMRVARSRDHLRTLGTPASPSLVELMSRGGASGSGRTLTLEGEPGDTAYVRLPGSGWAVAISIPSAALQAQLLRVLILYGGGILLSMGVALLMARAAARGINQPIEALRAAAEAMGQGRRPAAPVTPIEELAALGRAMVDAAQLRENAQALAQQASAERAQLLESERAARAEAQRESAIKDDFVATLSHELRTPLSAVLGWAQILRRKIGSPEDQAKGLEIIERNARLQAQLIDDLLDMSRIVAGKVRLEVQSVMPAAFIEAAVETLRPAAQARSLRLDVVLDPQAGPVVGDPGRLQQVVWNLLSNAIKFTPAGGRVQVLLQRRDSHIEITVADSGAGIAADFLPRVFQRFRQADASTTRRYGGLGLGLAISKHLVELHGGTIEARSAGEGRGATFVVKLSLSAVQPPSGGDREPQRRIEPAPAAEFRPVDLSGLDVLVVDDEPDARELVARVLEECGARTRTAASAHEALATIAARVPDVLVSDISMPDVDGFELLRRVRALPPERGGRLPAIALTALARSEDRTRALRAGFLAHMAKPVESAELVAAIAAVCGRVTGH